VEANAFIAIFVLPRATIMHKFIDILTAVLEAIIIAMTASIAFF